METPKYKPHVNIGKIKCDGRGGLLGQLPKDYPSEREMLQNALQQISQIQADKAELLEALESVVELQRVNYGSGMQTHIAMISKAKEIQSLIQKHKPCENK